MLDFCVFTPQPLKDCRGIGFTHAVWMGGWVAGKSLSGLYLRNRKVYEVDTRLGHWLGMGWGCRCVT